MYKYAKKMVSQPKPWPSGTEITFKGVDRTERPAAARWAFEQAEFGSVIRIKFEG